MICDTKKLADLRLKLALNQEALAGKAKLHVRTIQRAEAGKKVGAQTVQEIATALGVTPAQIIAATPHEPTPSDPADVEPVPDGLISIDLRPQGNATELLAMLADCDDCKMECTNQLSDQQFSALQAFCELIGPVLPQICPAGGYSSSFPDDANEATRLVARITFQRSLDTKISELGTAGLVLRAATYITWMIRPLWDDEENCWYTKSGFRPEAVKIGVLAISHQDAKPPTLRVKINDAPF
jgi:transcriptional regulator with XRE-family HTH domain